MRVVRAPAELGPFTSLAPRGQPFLKWAGGKRQLLGELLPHQAHGNVGQAAGCEGDDDLDRLIGVGSDGCR